MKLKLTIFILSILSGCVGIHASPYNDEEQCWEESVEVSSEFRLFGGCVDAVVTTQKDGMYWLFSNGCVPSGFARINGEELVNLGTMPCEE